MPNKDAFATMTDRPPNLNGDPALERLKEAVRMGGGQTAVSARSGVPMRSLSNYLSARNEMKLATAAAICSACGVTMEWLATGQSPMRPSDPPPPAPPVDDRDALFATLDMDRMAAAMAGAHEAFARKGTKPSWRRLAQVTALIYDGIGDASQIPDVTDGDQKS